MTSAALFANPFGLVQSLDAKSIEVDDYKALVCIMLSGGNDSFNMLVPTNRSSYAAYKRSRSNLALTRSNLHPLSYQDKKGQTFGLHSAMPKTHELFNQKKLSFIANIGPLIKPTTKQGYFQNGVELPLGLMSHADQLRHWLTSIPNERVNYGVGGRIADLVQKNNDNHKISMNISLAGSNYFQNGFFSNEYAITNQGSVGLNINEKRNELDEVLYRNFNNMLEREYVDGFKQTYMDILRQAQNNHDEFKQATASTQLKTSFSKTQLSEDLKMVAKTIASSKKLGMKRQTFYVLYHGWDHHDELLESHEEMLGVLDDALFEFNEALEVEQLSQNVITFTTSDFGRSLTSNGNGTDHAWGGNSLIMGQSINGGDIFGEYPSLELESSLDIGGGVLIPTLPTDALYSKLLKWYGLNNEAIHKILPNSKNFKSFNHFNLIKEIV